MRNPFDWEYLTRVPRAWEAYGPLALTYLGVFTVGLILSLALRRWLARRYRDHALHRNLARRGAELAAWVFGIGLALFIPRALELPFLGMRLWLYLGALLPIGLLVAFIWHWRARYPAELEEYERERERQRYLRPSQPVRTRRPAPARRATPPRRRR